MQFIKFKKIPRLSRDVIITEKIDGTNGQIYIASVNEIIDNYITTIDSKVEALVWIAKYCLYEKDGLCLFAGSRKRWLARGDDNFGFAFWVEQNAKELMKLEEGHHFGEWYGKGIQRNYGLDHKRFALFNVGKWNDETKPKCCDVVPILYEGEFDTESIENVLDSLKIKGSEAVVGFNKPEGIIIFHRASGHLYKKTCEND